MAERTDTEERLLLWACRLALLSQLHERIHALTLAARARVMADRVEALRVLIRQRKAELLGAQRPEHRAGVNHARKWQSRG